MKLITHLTPMSILFWILLLVFEKNIKVHEVFNLYTWLLHVVFEEHPQRTAIQ